MPKGKAPTPLKGPIKSGTGKAMIAEAGGGRKALKTWRSLSKSMRQGYKAKAAAGTASMNIVDAMKAMRATRAQRGAGPVSGKRPFKPALGNLKTKLAAGSPAKPTMTSKRPGVGR